mmetsp:Transcript_6041/g.9228  ORF Transcript_6041/g.9228 Transcript_6041/m.9228 type:complete len:80 (-) Transcript_6041:711-950(-)
MQKYTIAGINQIKINGMVCRAAAEMTDAAVSRLRRSRRDTFTIPLLETNTLDLLPNRYDKLLMLLDEDWRWIFVLVSKS